jgi:hypothetical protein
MTTKIKYQHLFIYKTTNLLNNRIYVGYHQTDDLNDGYIGCGIHGQKDAKLETLFHRAVRKYGYENFKCEVIEDNINDFIQLKKREIFYIKELKAHISFGGYNLTWGGDGGDTFTYSLKKEQTRKKLHDLFKDKKKSKEHCQHISEANIGKKMPKETIEKRRQTLELDPYIPTEETKQNQRIAYANRSIQICSYCGFASRNIGNMKQNHFDNCEKNPNYIPRLLRICPWCEKQGTGVGMTRFHFDNCEKNPNKIITEELIKKKEEANKKRSKTLKNKPIQICQWCGFQSNNAGDMKQHHGNNCRRKLKVA